MTDFMYIFWNKGGKPPRWTAEEMQLGMQRWKNWTDGLSRGGHLKGGESLDYGGKLVHGPKKTVSDGPYTEAGDVISGYLIISAKDLKEAVELSKDCPVLEGGWMVEVRPVHKM